jgi:hypothetical protein
MKSSSQLAEDADSAVAASERGKQVANPLVRLLNNPRLTIPLIVISVAGIFLLYSASFQPDRFGFYRDDSMYVVMGKALASGQGYKIISLPDEPLQTKSPPFYPFLLSMIWKLKPEFPQNLTVMMMLSSAITILFLGFTYFYLVRHGYAGRWQALVVVVLAAINWRTIVLATGMYSEMFYAALSVVALYLAEKYEKGRNNWFVGCALGLLTGLAFLSRSAGVALLLALAVYFLLRRQRNGVLPVAIAGVLVLGWLAWGYLNSTAIQDTNAGSYETYFQTLRALIARDGHASWTALFGVIAKNALGLVLISIPVVCLGLAYESVIYFGFAFLFIAAGFVRQSRAKLRLMHIYVVTYLLVHLLWPYTAYDRFLMPLLPFLLLFMLIEVEAIFALIWKVFAAQKELIGRVSAAFIGLALVIMAGATLYNYGLGIYRSLSLATLGRIPQPASEDAEAIEWIKLHTDPSDVVICYRDPLYYLYTGRKAARSSLVRDGGFLQPSDGGTDEAATTLFRIVNDNNARYWVSTRSDFGLEYQPDVERQNYEAVLVGNRDVFEPMFESADQGTRIYRINRR